MAAAYRGNIVDILNQRIFWGEVIVQDGRIKEIRSLASSAEANAPYLLPGFIDAHVHIESSMLVPAQFARLAVVHGTVATVSDPHEIANVCGLPGIEYMIQNGKASLFKFNFGAPSCVPATPFETAGATLNVQDIEALMAREDILYLSEMMNFPGVLNGEAGIMAKISAAKKNGKPVDGHAPGLRGNAARKYIAAGMSTDHECFTKEEALDKLQHGMKILIREGSAAKNFEALVDLLHEYADELMFCSDDKHPDSLVEGHINQLCSRAVAKGINVFHVLKAACINPVLHYKLAVGLLKQGDWADFIVVKDLKNFEVLQTFINGQLVAEKGKSMICPVGKAEASVINHFNCRKKETADFETIYKPALGTSLPVIEALDGQLITNKLMVAPLVKKDKILTDIENDVLKMVVVNRYHDAPIAKAFVKNFGLKRGALASSVAHDSHNIVAVGADDESLCKAVNAVIDEGGGISVINGNEEKILPLPIAGLMSVEDGYTVAERYMAMDQAAKEMGSTLSAPFMTLSFMALLVIPHIKLSDKGLFDGDLFQFMA